MLRKQKAFTLIEVLVASVILFLAVTTMMTVYQGAMLSSFKANQGLDLSLHVQHIRRLISEEIREVGKPQSQKSGVYGDVKYIWTTVKVAEGRAYHPDNTDFSMVIPGRNRGSKIIYLWRIELVLDLKNSTRNYEFWEISW